MEKKSDVEIMCSNEVERVSQCRHVCVNSGMCGRMSAGMIVWVSKFIQACVVDC